MNLSKAFETILCFVVGLVFINPSKTLKVLGLIAIGFLLFRSNDRADCLREANRLLQIDNQDLHEQLALQHEQLVLQQAEREHAERMTQTYSNALRYELSRSERLESTLTKNVSMLVTQ